MIYLLLGNILLYKKNQISYLVWYAVLAGLCVVALWLPFGFEMGALIEEWGILGLYQKYGIFYITGPDGVAPHFAMRPLTILTHAIADRLSPHSFVAWHVLLIAALLLKGLAGGWLILRMSHSRVLGAMAVLLFIVYPADTMQIALRGIHIDWAITLSLLGACATIYSLEAEKPKISIPSAIIASACSVAGLAMYETSFALLLFVPGYFYIKFGFSKAIRFVWQKWNVLFIYFFGLGLYGAYLASVVSGAKGSGSATYQASLIGENGISAVYAVLPKLFTVGGFHLLLGGWLDSIAMIHGQPFSNIAYLVAWCFVIAVFFLVFKKININSSAPLRNEVDNFSSIRMILVGMIIALAGYFPYIFSPSHVVISQRTFIAASPGAALLWIGVLSMILKKSRTAVFLLFGVGLFFGSLYQLYQFSHYDHISTVQKRLLSEVVQKYKKSAGGSSVLVLDHSNLLGHTWMFLPENLGNALSYVMGRSITSLEICRQPAGEWMRRDVFGRTGHCYEKNGRWIYEMAEPAGGPGFEPSKNPTQQTSTAPDDVVVLEVGKGILMSDERVDGYQEKDFTGLYTNSWPLKGTLWKSPYRVGACYKWGFGDVWSLELPIWGNGWREAEWSIAGRNKSASAWSFSKNTNLYFELIPADDEYALRLKLTAAASQNIAKNLKIFINDEPIDIIVTGNDVEGNISGKSLKSGVNSISLQSESVIDYYGLSFMMDSIEIKPIDSKNSHFMDSKNPC